MPGLSAAQGATADRLGGEMLVRSVLLRHPGSSFDRWVLLELVRDETEWAEPSPGAGWGVREITGRDQEEGHATLFAAVDSAVARRQLQSLESDYEAAGYRHTTRSPWVRLSHGRCERPTAAAQPEHLPQVRDRFAVWIPSPIAEAPRAFVFTARFEVGTADFARATYSDRLWVARVPAQTACCNSRLALVTATADNRRTASFVHDRLDAAYLELPDLGGAIDNPRQPTAAAVTLGGLLFEPLRLAGLLVLEEGVHGGWVDAEGRLRAWEPLARLREPRDGRFALHGDPGLLVEGSPARYFNGEGHRYGPPGDLDFLARGISERAHSDTVRQL